MLNNQQVANGTLLGKITEAGTMTGFVICFVSVRAGEILTVSYIRLLPQHRQTFQTSRYKVSL